MKYFCLLVVLVSFVVNSVTAIGQTNFGAQANGDWDDSATWNPSGPPLANDNVFIGSTLSGALPNVSVTLTGDESIRLLSLGANAGTSGTLELAGNTVSASTFRIGEAGGTGTVNHGGGSILTTNLSIASANSFVFDASDRTNSTSIFSAANATTADAANIAESVSVSEANSTLNLGADLSLSGSLDIRGNAGFGQTVATVDANGFSINANDIFVGRFGSEGALNNADQIIARRDFEVSGGTFTLDSNDSVARNVVASDGGSLNLDSATSAEGAMVMGGSTINTVASNNVSGGVSVFEANSTLNLGADLSLSGSLDIRGNAGFGQNVATVDANGFGINANDIFVGRFGSEGALNNADQIIARRDFEVSGGTFTLDSNDSVARNVVASDGGLLNLDSATSAEGAMVMGGSTINTVTSNNVSGGVSVFEANSALNLGADLSLSGSLDIRGNAGFGQNVATVDANGFGINANDIFVGRFGSEGALNNADQIIARRDFEVSGGTFTLDSNDSVARNVVASDGGLLNLDSATSAEGAMVMGGSTINTVASNNVSGGVSVFEANSALNLGADLSLSGSLDIRGNAGFGQNVATVDANGFSINANDIFVGRFGSEGALNNADQIIARRDFEVSGGTFTLDSNDSVARNVVASDGGLLNLDSATSAEGAVVMGGSTINTVASNNVSGGASVFEANSALNLGADLSLSGSLDIRGNAGVGQAVATVDANGFSINANDIFVGRFGSEGALNNADQIIARRDFEVSGGTFTLDSNDSVARNVVASDGGSLNLDSATNAEGAMVMGGSTINTVASNNVSGGASVFEANSALNLGADLSLSGSLDIRGNAGFGQTVATVDANGFSINANDIFVGRFGSEGALNNAENIQANGLLVDSSSLNLGSGEDIVNALVRLENGSILTIEQSANSFTGLTLGGNSLDILDSSILDLQFDDSSDIGLGWAFRWANPVAGDRVGVINSLIEDGRITLDTSFTASVFDNGDGFTHVGFTASIPEPSGVLPLFAFASLFVNRRRRN